MLGQSQSQVIREAQKEIAQYAQARRVPRILWAGLEETAEAFALRCARLQNGGIDRILAAVRYGFPVPDGVQRVDFAPKIFRLMHPSTPSRYRVVPGGRGSGKSHGVATALVLRALAQRMRILCGREFMKSLRESVHHLIEGKIDALGLTRFFDVTDRAITCVVNKSEFIFAGLFQNSSALKSLEEITICWLEQAETVSSDSLEILVPTIRDTGSEIWMTLNPDDPQAPAQEYADGMRPDTLCAHMTFEDNPWWPAALEGERVYLQSVDPDAYSHIYLGTCRSASDAQVFKGKYSIEAFEPDLTLKPTNDRRKDAFASVGQHEAIARIERHERESVWQGPFQGADWGFSVDPSVLIRCWTYKRTLYIEYEAYEVGCDINKTPALFDQIPDARKFVTRGDNARPETISYLQQNGYPKLTAVDKWKGCVEDGIAFMRSYERIVIHPRCTNTAAEFRLYSHKVVKLTGDILPDLEDKNNHTIDAIRYALTPAIRQRRAGRIDYNFWSRRNPQ